MELRELFQTDGILHALCLDLEHGLATVDRDDGMEAFGLPRSALQMHALEQPEQGPGALKNETGIAGRARRIDGNAHLCRAAWSWEIHGHRNLRAMGISEQLAIYVKRELLDGCIHFDRLELEAQGRRVAAAGEEHVANDFRLAELVEIVAFWIERHALKLRLEAPVSSRGVYDL